MPLHKAIKLLLQALKSIYSSLQNHNNDAQSNEAKHDTNHNNVFFYKRLSHVDNYTLTLHHLHHRQTPKIYHDLYYKKK